MSAEPPVDHAALTHADSQVAAAHHYFSTVVEQWLGTSESEPYAIKAKELTDVLVDGLQLVSIELDASDNSQEIFETLNARGTPLTAADLVRNFVNGLVERVTGHLARLNVTSTYWPGDEELRLTLATEAACSRFPRSRLRMVLEALEDHYRTETGQPQVERKGYPIEHILPRAWTDTWPVDTPEEIEARQQCLHRLGNLTLLTKSLNSKVSPRCRTVRGRKSVRRC